ncbi:hypothetical protein [Pseudonocardia xishanensis]|uniref:Uncharacterized protein n=1 Tax=Pseudonocardia xishanensis TaxID=630995 RepID=A0ABP8RYB6_9PSEU
MVRVPETIAVDVPTATVAVASPQSPVTEFELRHLGQTVTRFSMSVDQTDATVLDKVLRKAARRTGRTDPVDELELAILRPGEPVKIFAVLD